MPTLGGEREKRKGRERYNVVSVTNYQKQNETVKQAVQYKLLTCWGQGWGRGGWGGSNFVLNAH